MVVFPNCKINLGLNILRKREDGYHDLETVFYPLPLQDIVEIIPLKIPIDDSRQHFSISGLTIGSNADNNLCIKAYELLKKEFPKLPPIQMHLHKTIPAGAGLGGGSSDASFTLKLLNTIGSLGLQEEELLKFAGELGSDCPFFIINKPCIATGRGEILEKISFDLSGYKLIIVNPGIHVDTAAMFREIKPGIPKRSLKEIIQEPLTNWKHEMKNDFEEIVFRLVPEIAKIKRELYDEGAIYSSMSGSGSTVYGIFLQEQSPVLSFPSHYFIQELPGSVI